MPRYIDADALIELIDEFEPENWTNSDRELQAVNDFELFRSLVKAEPTADVAEVKRGEWAAYPDEYEICATEFVCSCCKQSFASSELTDEQFFDMMKYCPNCGADMRGDKR